MLYFLFLFVHKAEIHNTSFAGVYLQHRGDRERRVSVCFQEHFYFHHTNIKYANESRYKHI